MKVRVLRLVVKNCSFSQSDMTDVVTKGLNEGSPSEIQNSQEMSTVDPEPNHKVSK